MKILSLIAALAGIVITQVNTQAQGLYVGVGGGYGFPSGVQANPYPASTTTFINGNNSSGTVTASSYSLGGGASVGAYFGYMMNKNVGIELGVADKLSSSTTTTQNQTYLDSAGGGTVASGSATTTTTIKGSLFSLTPSIRLMAGDNGDKLRPFLVTGLVIGFPSSEVDMTSSGTQNSGNSVDILSMTSTDKYSGGMIIGFHGALGIIYNVTDKIGIFGQVACNLQNWSPSKDVMTSTETQTGSGFIYTNNTTSTTTYGSSVSTNSKTQNGTSTYNGFSNTFNYNNGNGTSSQTTTTTGNTENVNVTNTQNANNTYLPFSSWGISIGIHFNFGGGASSSN